MEGTNNMLAIKKEVEDLLPLTLDSDRDDLAIKEEIVEENLNSFEVITKQELCEERPDFYYGELTHVKQENEMIIEDDETNDSTGESTQLKAQLPRGLAAKNGSELQTDDSTGESTQLKAQLPPGLAGENGSEQQTLHSNAENENLCQEKSTKVQKRRSKRRKNHYCKFCNKNICYLSRHFKNVHSDESAIRKYMAATGVEKTTIFRKLMEEGDTFYNTNHPGSPIGVRSASVGSRANKKLICRYCNNYYSKKNFYRHLKVCNTPAYQNRKSEKMIALVESSPLPASFNFQMANKIMPKIRDGPLRNEILNDKMIIEHGNMLTEKYESEGQQKMIASFLRIISKITIGIKERAKKNNQIINNATECFQQKFYKYFVLTIRDMAGAGTGRDGEYKKPSTVHQYGQQFRHFSNTVAYELRLNEETEKIMHVEEWKEMFDTSYADRVSSVARKQADRKTHSARNAIPSMDDVQKLIEFVKTKLVETYDSLNEEFSEKKYKELVKMLMLKLWVFNRKRVKEVQEIRLDNWTNIQDINKNSAEFQTLQPSEKLYADCFKRLSVKGKLGRTVALLVFKEDLKYFDLMLKLRSSAEIDPDNKYLFARGSTFVEGTSAMREFANKCGAQNPELLRGTKLRKHLDVCLQNVSLSAEELCQVAETLGHREDTHMNFYRHPVSAIHLGRVSKVLAALDSGNITDYQGMSLNEIAIGEEKSSGEVRETSHEDIEKTPVRPQSSQPSTSGVVRRGKELSESEWSGGSDESEDDVFPRGDTPGRKRKHTFRGVKQQKRMKWTPCIKKSS